MAEELWQNGPHLIEMDANLIYVNVYDWLRNYDRKDTLWEHIW